MKEKEKFAIEFLRWVDENYFQGKECNSFAKSEEDFIHGEVLSIEGLMLTFKNINN